MVPTRQSAPLLQEPSGPDPPTCGAAMELLMLFNYFGYQGPQNRFRTCVSDQRMGTYRAGNCWAPALTRSINSPVASHGFRSIARDCPQVAPAEDTVVLLIDLHIVHTGR